MKSSDEITYGSLILLRTNLSDYMTSKGFIDTSLYTGNESNIDFSLSTFQILPQCIYSSQHDILKKLQKHPNQNTSEIILKRSENLEGEFKTNIQTFSNLFGKPLRYGSFIQLLHVKSQKFLSHKSGDYPQNAEIERENLRLILEDYADELSHFRIEPSLKYQLARNGVVKSGDKVNLVGISSSFSKNVYIHASEVQYMYTIACDTAFEVCEVNASMDAKTDWEIELFAPAQVCEHKSFEFGNSFWINHSENEQSIIASFRGIHSQMNKHIALYPSRFDSNGLWTIESLDCNKGGRITTNTEFRLKHLITGKYLIIDPEDYFPAREQSNIWNSVKLGERSSPCCTWKLESIDQDDILVSDDSYFRLFNPRSELYLTGLQIPNQYTDSQLEITVSENRDDQGVFKLVKAEDYHTLTTSFLQNCLPILHAFPAHHKKFMDITHPSVEEIREMDRLMNIKLNCMDDLLLYCRNKLPSMIRVNKQYGEVQLFRQNILREQLFIDALVEILDNIFTDEQSRKKLKKMHREHDVDISPEESIILTCTEKSFRETYYEYLIKISKKVYELIKTICLHNKVNQEYTFNFFTIFCNHAGLGLGATDSLLSIISNNENLLLKLHTSSSSDYNISDLSIIEFYINLLAKYHKSRKPYLLNFLRSICRYKGKGISVNQDMIFELIINNLENFNKIMIPMRLRKHNSIEVEIHSPFAQSDFTISLNDFIRRDFQVTTENQLEYFRNQLGLLADICLGRNKLCIETIRTWFPIEKLHGLLWTSSLSIPIRACIVRLIICLHADCYPREVIVKPELIKLLKLNLQGSNSKMGLGKFLSQFGIMETDCIGLKDSVYAEYEPVPQLSTEVSYSQNTFMKLQSQFRERDCTTISQEELPIYRLADDLLLYFYKISHKGEIDELTYELINMAKKFVLFEIYSDKCIILEEGVAIAAESKVLQAHEMGIIRITSVLIKLLLGNVTLISDINGFSRLETDKSKTNKLPQEVKSKMIKQFNEIQYSDTGTCSNPIRNKAVNLKNFLNSLFMMEPDMSDDRSFESRAKEEICEIINLYLDWRLDYLIYNVIEWFNMHDQYLVFDKAEIKSLLPNIMKVGTLLETDKYEHKEFKNIKYLFKNYIPFEIYDLNVVFQREILPYLTKSFVEAKNIQLQGKLLNLIMRCYSQRKQLIKTIRKLHMINEVNEANVYAWSKLNISRLREFSAQSKVFIKEWNYSDSFTHPQTRKFNSILKIIQNLRYILQADSFVLYGNPNKGSGPISSDRQLLLYYLGLHTCLLHFIKDSAYTLEEVHKEIGEEIYSSRIHLILTQCFNLLSELTYNNPLIQEDLHSYIPLLTENLNVDMNQMQLCCEIYKDNLDLCTGLTEKDLKPFINSIIVIGRKPRFLKIFQVMIVVKDQPILSAQRLVLNALFGRESEFILNLQTKTHEETLTRSSTRGIRMSGFGDSSTEEDLRYHAELIQLLSTCCLGSTNLSLNEAKCQKWIKLDDLFELLNRCEKPETGMMILKIPLLEFFYHAYIDIEKKYEDLTTHPKLLEYLDYHTFLLNQVDQLNLSYIIFLKIWLKILQGYRERYIINYSWNYADIDSRMIKEYLLAIMNNSYKFNSRLDEDTFKIFHKLCLDYSIELSEEDITYILEPQIIDTKPDISSNHKNINHILERWYEIRGIFKHSGSIRKMVRREKKMLYYYLFYVSDYIPTITLDTLSKTLVNFIRQSKISNLNKETVYYAIKLLGKILEHPFMYMNESEKAARLRVQSMFQSHGTCIVALNLLSDPSIEMKLFKTLLKLLVFMLEGGNMSVQEECYNFFMSVHSSEYLFSKLNSILNVYIDKMNEVSQRSNLSSIKKEEPLIKFVLRFLQLLCENHNNQLQNYLRNQTRSKVSYNLVDKTIKLLETSMKYKFAFSFISISQCFDTLSEMIQGPCLENQRVIIDSKFLDFSSGLLSINDDYLTRDNIVQCVKASALKKLASAGIPRLDTWMISHLKYKCLITIHALLEGSTDLFIITRLSRAFNIEMLKQNIYTLFQAFRNNYGIHYYHKNIFKNYIPDKKLKKIKKHSEVKQKHLPVIENGFLIYFLIKYFIDYGVLHQEKESKCILETQPSTKTEYGIGDILLMKLEKRGIVLYSRKQHIKPHEEEVIDYETNLFKEACQFFQSHTGNIEVIFTDNVISKVYFPLPPEASAITPDIKEQFEDEVDRSSYKNKLQSLINSAPNVIEKIQHENNLNKFFNRYKYLRFIAVHHKLLKDLAFANCLVINFLILASYSGYKTNRLHEPSLFYHESNEDSGGLNVYNTSLLISVLGAMECIFAILIVSVYLIKAAPVEGKRGWNKVPIYHGHAKQPRIARIIQQSIRALYAIGYVLNVNVIFYIAYLYFALCGVFIHPFFFAFHLFEILYRFPSLQNVLKSVSVPAKSLFLTFLFTLVIVYIFALLGYYWYYDYFQGNCPSLFICYLTVFDKGFKANGGIGGYLDNWETGNIFFGRYFYDNLYNIIVMIIMLNIVQGIIIDTFAVLRERSDTQLQDRENVCFICNVDRATMERRTNKNFRDHRHHDHNEFNYIFFIDHLLSKDPVDYTGIESHVREGYEKGDINWFPQRRALAFKEGFENDEDIIKDKQDEIHQKLSVIDSKVDELLRKI
jgi:hypothetical protein